MDFCSTISYTCWKWLKGLGWNRKKRNIKERRILKYLSGEEVKDVGMCTFTYTQINTNSFPLQTCGWQEARRTSVLKFWVWLDWPEPGALWQARSEFGHLIHRKAHELGTPAHEKKTFSIYTCSVHIFTISYSTSEAKILKSFSVHTICWYHL